MQVGLGVRLWFNCIREDCRAQDTEHMSQRPFCVPLAESPTRGPRLWKLVTLGDVPQADQALYQPHPRRQLLDALPTPVLRSLNLHYLLARFEGNLDRPSSRERGNHPTELGIYIRGEQILVGKLALRVADQHHKDRQQAAHLGPDRLEGEHLQLARGAVACRLDRLPNPRPLSTAVAVGLLDSLLGKIGREG